MATENAKEETPPTMEDMIEMGTGAILRALGKGEDLRGALWAIINSSAQWGIDNHKRREAELKANKKA